MYPPSLDRRRWRSRPRWPRTWSWIWWMASRAVVCSVILATPAFGAEAPVDSSVDGRTVPAPRTVAEIERLNGEVYDLLWGSTLDRGEPRSAVGTAGGRDRLGSDHPATATALHNFASSWRKLHAWPTRCPCCAVRWLSAEKIHGVEIPDIAVPAAVLGLILLELGQAHEAVQLLQRASALIEKAEGSSSDNWARAPPTTSRQR